MTPDELAEALRGRVQDVVVARGEVTATIDAGGLLETLTALAEDDDLAFRFLIDIACTDWPGRDPRIWMAYHLLSLEHGHRVRLKAGLSEPDLRIASATSIFPAANWLEREVYDMFGVAFDGHPDLRRILLPPEWTDHPLRKDAELGGVPTQYKGATIPPPDQRGL